MTNGVTATKAVLVDKTRRKRLKVVSACGECRRKKTKCNGEQPCTGCIKANAECKYALSTTTAGRQAAAAAAVGNYVGLTSSNHSPNRHNYLIVAPNRQRTGNSGTQPPAAGHRAQPHHPTPNDIPKHDDDEHRHHHISTSASLSQQRPQGNAGIATTAPIKPTPHIHAIEHRLVVIEDILRALLAGHTGQNHLLVALDQQQQQQQKQNPMMGTAATAYCYKENTCDASAGAQPKEGATNSMTTAAITAAAVPLSTGYPVQLAPITHPAAVSNSVNSSSSRVGVGVGGSGGPSIRSLLNEREDVDGSPSRSPLSSSSLSSSTSSSTASTSLSPILTSYRQQRHHHISPSAFQRVNTTTPTTSSGGFS